MTLEQDGLKFLPWSLVQTLGSAVPAGRARLYGTTIHSLGDELRGVKGGKHIQCFKEGWLQHTPWNCPLLAVGTKSSSWKFADARIR